jgi:uncharacterized protein with HEPN domain
MRLEVLKYLEDIKLSIELIEKYVSDLMTLEEYEADDETIDSVERRLAIIGEAMSKADKLEPSLAITDKAKIIGLRHILVHEYNLISSEAIWKIIKTSLVILKPEVEKLLNEHGLTNY